MPASCGSEWREAIESLRNLTAGKFSAPDELTMNKNRVRMIEDNGKYADGFGELSALSGGPARKTAILTCMDARMDPAKFAGLAEGDAHVIRNAGGRASDDAIRSLVISHKMFGTTEWFVIQHTSCGMATFTDDAMGDLLAESLDPAIHEHGRWQNAGSGPGSDEGRSVKWLTIGVSMEESVCEDVRRIADHPLVSPKISIYGYIYDVATGRLQEVEGASRPACE